MEEQKELPVFDAALFGRRVVTRRKNIKKKQIELAEQVGISQQHMSGIELGNDRVSFDVFLKLCIALNVNPDYLLGGAIRSSNIPQSVVEGINQCSPPDQVLAAEIIELLRKRNPENK